MSDGHEPHRGGEKDGLYSGSENKEQSKADGAAVSGVLRICSNHVFGDVFSVVVVQLVALCTDLNEEQQAAKETHKIQKERSQVRTQSTTCISRFFIFLFFNSVPSLSSYCHTSYLVLDSLLTKQHKVTVLFCQGSAVEI